MRAWGIADTKNKNGQDKDRHIGQSTEVQHFRNDEVNSNRRFQIQDRQKLTFSPEKPQTQQS